MGSKAWVIASLGGVDEATLSKEQRDGYLGVCGFDEILKTVTDTRPDYLAVDAVIPGGDVRELAKSVSLAHIETLPVMIALTPLSMAKATRTILDRVNVRAILKKPVTGAQLNACVETATLADRLGREGCDKGAIARLLWKLGFTPASCGFEYTMSAIELVARDIRAVKSLSGTLYPQLAAMYDTDADNVETAIRRAMDSAWSCGSQKTQYALFANTIDEYRGKPTLQQMFACIAERLYSGMEIDI